MRDYSQRNGTRSSSPAYNVHLRVNLDQLWPLLLSATFVRAAKGNRMSLIRISCTIALAVFVFVAQLAWASSVQAGVATGSQNEPTSDNAAILDVLRGVEGAFSDMDLPRWLSHFHSSYLIMAPQGVIAPASESEALAILRPHIESLQARGYARSELDRATVKLLSETTALAAVQWIRRKADEEELERVGATYALFKSEDGWKIVMVTVHSPAALLELE